MGAYVGRIGIKDGRGVMTDWRYEPGDKHLPPDDEVRKLRPAP
jgi:branched-chain amino acid transport system substrate-binding protein